MPLYVLKKEEEFEEIVLERRVNVIVFTVCWSLGSKMIYPTIFELSTDPNLSQIHFYRIDIDEKNLEWTEHLNITSIPTIRWYFHGNKLDELIGVNLEQLIDKTNRLANIYKHKTTSKIILTSTNHQ